MADQNYIDRTAETKIVGQDSTGNSVNYVSADTNGNMLVKDYSDGVPASAVPPVATQVGGSDGSNLRTVLTDKNGRPIVGYAPGTIETFGAITTNHRHNSLQIDFSNNSIGATISHYLTASVTGSGGNSLNTNGTASFYTGTSGTGYSSGQTPTTVIYQSGSEVYAEFSVAFTAPTSANSFQKIGLYNSANGFYIGYIGTTFGITSRQNSVDTTVAQVSWNLDTLTGAAGSLFTRNGVPEAINLTYLNIFRIRFGWLGVATIVFETFSPDGVWVAFHKILYPNTVSVPSVQTPNLPLFAEVNTASADSTNITIVTACWAAGILDIKFPDTIVQPENLGALNAAITVTLAGSNSVGFQLNAGTLVGTITPQCSVDGGRTWLNCQFFNATNNTTNSSLSFSGGTNPLVIQSILPIGGSSHVQVVITSYTSGSAVSTLRASSITGTVGSSLVLADPQTFQYANIDARNELRTAIATLLIGNEQTGTVLDTNMWSTTLTGSGTSTVSGGQNTLATGTTANSAAFLGSLLRGRFLTGTVNAFIGGVRLGDTGTANNIRRWGAYDSSDGVYFVLNGTTIGIGIRSGGSDTVITSLNGSHTFTIDTNYHNYEIQWTAGVVYFYQDGNLVHTYSTTSTPLATTSSFKLGFETTNSSGSTTNAQMFIRGSSIIRYGQALARPRYFHPFYTNRVQAASAANPGNNETATATINSTGSGNLIIVTAFIQAGTLTCTDSASQTYSTAINQSGTGGNPPNVYTFYKANTSAGVTSVTVTTTSGNTGISLIVTEYAGVITSSPLDKTASSGTSASGTAWSSTATATTTQAQELLIGNVVDTHVNTTTVTSGINWNAITTIGGATGGGGTLFQEEQYVTATGTYAATGTLSASNAYLATISTFKLTSSSLSSGFTIPNTPTTIKIGPGTLQKIIINTQGTGGAIVTLYDNTTNSGSVLAILSLTEGIGQFPYDLDFSTGLTMVINSISADFTVIYD